MATGSITLRYGQVASTCAVVMDAGPCSGVNPNAPSPEAWSSPVTFTPPPGATTVTVVVGTAAFGGVDPLPGVYKTVQIVEQSSVQTITINGQEVSVPGSSSTTPVTPSSGGWFTLNAPEGSVIAATGSITLRYGQVASTCAVVMDTGPCSGVSPGAPSPEAWTSPQTFTPAYGETTITVVVGRAAFGGVDPLPGVYKTVQVEELSSAQTITVNGQQVTVPASSTTSTCLLTATPSSISFQNTTVGYNYSATASLVSNCPTTITVTGAPVSGPYGASGFQTPFSIGPYQMLNYTAVFAPNTTGTANGSITFISNATSDPTLTVSLAGTGVSSSSSQPVTNHAVTLSWSESSGQIAGFNVYRSGSSGGAYSKINSGLLNATSYSDQTVVSGGIYYYAVTAVGTDGTESGYSNEANVIIPNP